MTNGTVHAAALRDQTLFDPLWRVDACRRTPRVFPAGDLLDLAGDWFRVEELAAREGLFVALEGGVCIAAVKKLRQSGVLGKADRILIYNTGSGYKYLEAWKQYLSKA